MPVLRTRDQGDSPTVSDYLPRNTTVLDTAVNYWKLDEAGTDDRVDSIGTDDLTPAEAITTTAGKNNDAANFDASTHTMVNAAWRGTGWTGMTVSAWLNRSADVVSGSGWFHTENVATNNAFAGYIWTTGRATFFVRNTAASIQVATTPGDIGSASDWVHYCGSWNADDNVRLFINGVELGTSAGVLTGTLRDNAVGIWLGSVAVSGINPYQGGNEGYLDEVAIFDYGVGLDGAVALYNDGEGLFL